MATQILNSDAAIATRMLQIESKQLIPGVLPTIAIGDILNVTVRQNPQTGQGSLFFKGLLINATLPANVQPGDKLQAKVVENGDQIQFKIVNLDRAPEAPKPQTARAQLAEKITQYLKSEEIRSPATLFPVKITENIEIAGVAHTQLASLLAQITSPEILQNPKEVFESILAATKGEQPVALKETAQAIRNFVEKYSPPPEAPQFTALRERLTRLLTEATEGNRLSARDITALIENTEREVREKKKLDPKERESLKLALQDLKQLPEPEVGDTGQSAQRLQSALSKLESLPALRLKLAENMLEPQAQKDLLQLASRLEQMANTQDLLNKLNPLMQAMGEPALILLPFLFQGLFQHSEVTVESWAGNKKKDGSQSSDGGSGRTVESFNRVQVHVPLPTLGDVHVDIAHRSNEILVRFSISDKASAGFIHDRLEELAGILRAQGFEHADLITHVGTRSGTPPEWSLALHTSTAIVA